MKFSVFEIETSDLSIKILSNRQLLILPPKLGEIVPSVTELAAANIGLVAVNRNAFEGLGQLKIVNLSRNEISEIESESFDKLLKLQVLDLSNNLIGSFENNTFELLSDLEVLILGHNRLTQLPENVFDPLFNLKTLVMSHNKIQDLRFEIFTGINQIEEFYIDNNQLHTVNPKIVSNFDTAKIIDFSGNACTNQRFPENLTMVQLAIEITEKCWSKIWL